MYSIKLKGYYTVPPKFKDLLMPLLSQMFMDRLSEHLLVRIINDKRQVNKKFEV